MHELINWKAKRAGGRITIYGQKRFQDGSAGEQVKIVGVDSIEPAAGHAIATDKDGHTHRLAV